MRTMENDLISRSALLTVIDAAFERTDPDGDEQIGVLKCRRIIRTAPAVDAVEVVRCKDCIHYDFGVCLKIYSDGAVSQFAWQERKPDDFCSYGERRNDG